MSSELMLADDRPVDPDDELLVAYLDGELNVSERDEVEQRLMDEENLRKRLQTLQASWDVLDVLQATGANDQLVESTLELVVADIVQKSPSQAIPTQSRRWPWLTGFLCLATAVGMFGFVTANRSNKLQQELADLGLAENMDAYLYGADLELMRHLESKKRWNAMVKAARDQGDLNLRSKPIIADTPVEQRSDKLAKLSAEDRATLESRWDRFQRWGEQDRQTIRDAAAAVAEKSDSASLIKTMQTYAVWRDTLSSELREKIESGEDEIRDVAIDEAIKTTLAGITKASGESLTKVTSDVIFAAIEHFLDSRIKKNPSLGEDIEAFGTRIGNQDVARRFALRRMLGGSFGSFGSQRSPRPPRGDESATGDKAESEEESKGSETTSNGSGPSGFPTIDVTTITDGELLSIIDVLNADSGDHSRALRTLETLDDAGTLVVQTLLEWANEAMDRSRLWPTFERKSLLELYRELDPADRDAIDMLPPDKLKEELQRLNDPRRFRGSFRSPGR